MSEAPARNPPANPSGHSIPSSSGVRAVRAHGHQTGSVLALGEPFVLVAGAFVLVLVYALFRWGSTRQAAIGLVIATTDFPGLTDLVVGIVVLLFPAALGLSIRYRGIVRDQAFEQVRFQERETLSRELHDTVAHHVSAIAIQAQAGQFLATSQDLDGAAAALDLIETEASRTLAEMRSMVGTLRRRNAPPDVSVQHRVADIEALATADGAPGLRVDVDLDGNLDDLRPSVQAALYRVAQESITNAQRHARHATRVDVQVTADTESVRLSVSDDGERGQLIAGSTGYGLVGIAERMTLLGGTFHAGPRPERGWIVDATIPRQRGRS